MKRIIITAVLVLAYYCTQAQSIQLSHEGEVKNNGDTIYATEGDVYIDIENVSLDFNIVALKIKRNIISLLDSANTHFCFISCFGSNVDSTRDIYSLYPGEVLSRDNEFGYFFYAAYDSHGEKGISIVEYMFYDTNDVSDMAKIYIVYDTRNTSIKTNINNDISLGAYPNPTSGEFTIEHSLYNQASDARLIIYNLLGASLRSIPIDVNKSKTAVDISGLSSGIYLYSLEVDGRISSTQKIIIK